MSLSMASPVPRRGKPVKKCHRIQEMIQDTSLFAYRSATQNPGQKQKEVVDTLWLYADATNTEIAAHLNWPINRVTPRMVELRKMGLVIDGEKRRCKVPRCAAYAWKAKYRVLPPAFKEKKIANAGETVSRNTGRAIKRLAEGPEAGKPIRTNSLGIRTNSSRNINRNKRLFGGEKQSMETEEKLEAVVYFAALTAFEL